MLERIQIWQMFHLEHVGKKPLGVPQELLLQIGRQSEAILMK